MPTNKRRLPLSLTPELDAALTDLAEATGKGRATVAMELLTEMIPQLVDLAKIARHLKAGRKGAAKTALQHMVGNAMAEVMTQQEPLPLGKPKKGKA